MLKILIAGALVFFTTIQVSPQTVKASVQGTVIRFDTKEPLIDARVTIGISSAGPRQSPTRLLNFLSDWTVSGTELSTVTDRQGRFTFPILDPGDYIVSAALDGYTTVAKYSDGTSQVSDFARGITVSAGERSGDVALSLVPLANIRGQVRSPNGQGVAGVYVTIGTIEYRNGQRAWQDVKYTWTNEHGEYQILWLEPGSYYVAVAPQEGGRDYRQFMAAYFPDSLSFGSARSTIASNGSNPAVDITLPFKKTGQRTVSGNAVTGVLVREIFPSGVSPGPDMVYLVPRGGDWVLNSPVSNLLIGGISNSGDFQIRDVPPGSYVLYAVSHQRSRTYWGYIAVEVMDRDVTGQTITFTASSADYVSGRVLDENGVTYRANSPVLLARILLPFLSDYGNARGGTGMIPDPYFGFSRVLPGTYDLAVSYEGCRDCYLADIRQAGRSILDSGLVIDSKPAEPIDVLLHHNGGAVDIRIQGERGHSGMLLLVPEAFRRVNPSFFRDINITAQSTFTFENVAPGQYKIFAIEGSSNRDDLDLRGFLSKHENEGVSVTIRDGEKANARVELMRR